MQVRVRVRVRGRTSDGEALGLAWQHSHRMPPKEVTEGKKGLADWAGGEHNGCLCWDYDASTGC